jgi:hypothetical protein
MADAHREGSVTLPKGRSRFEPLFLGGVGASVY